MTESLPLNAQEIPSAEILHTDLAGRISIIYKAYLRRRSLLDLVSRLLDVADHFDEEARNSDEFEQRLTLGHAQKVADSLYDEWHKEKEGFWW